MTITRQDAWSKDEDLLLAEVVLRYIREGGTQLQAFEEVGRKITRTSAACGFRWNSLVRKQYQSGIELAKKQRKELKKQLKQEVREVEGTNQQNGNNPIRGIISSLEQLEEIWSTEQNASWLKQAYEKLELENVHLKKERDHWLSEYKTLLEVMEKARKMVYLNDEAR